MKFKSMSESDEDKALRVLAADIALFLGNTILSGETVHLNESATMARANCVRIFEYLVYSNPARIIGKGAPTQTEVLLTFKQTLGQIRAKREKAHKQQERRHGIISEPQSVSNCDPGQRERCDDIRETRCDRRRDDHEPEQPTSAQDQV